MRTSMFVSKDGLVNVGNTCFLNAAFQALRFTRPIQEFMIMDTTWRAGMRTLSPMPSSVVGKGTQSISTEDRKNIMEHLGAALVVQTAELMSALTSISTSTSTSTSSTANPRAFVRAFFEFTGFTSGDFQFGQMGDASEALHAILDGLHSNMCRPVLIEVRGNARTPADAELIDSFKSWSVFFNKEYSPFIQNYYGQTQMRCVCACGETKTVYEPWSSLKISIPGGDVAGSPIPSFRDCMNTAFMPETIADYSCDRCKQVGLTVKYYSVSRFPNVLFLVFKRFTDKLVKIQARIEYDPDCVSIEEWGAWPSFDTIAQSAETDSLPTTNALRRPLPPKGSDAVSEAIGPGIYRVISTIEQSGTMRGGHYSMRTRHPTDDGKWLLYDDDHVYPVGGDPTPDTYVLVLERD